MHNLAVYHKSAVPGKRTSVNPVSGLIDNAQMALTHLIGKRNHKPDSGVVLFH
jgi:hypothetical protein